MKARIKEINWVMNKMGSLFPIAILILNDKTEIKSALYNIQKIKPKVNDIVEVKDKGNFIFEVVDNYTKNELILPKRCPYCNHLLEVTEDDVFCVYYNCSERKKKEIVHWNETLGIQQMGELTISKLISVGLIRRLQDIYKLKIRERRVINAVGRKKAEDIIQQVEEHRNITLHQFLVGLNILIPIVAEQISELVYGDLDLLQISCKKQRKWYQEVKYFPESSSNYFNTYINMNNIELREWSNILNFIKEKNGKEKFTDMKFVITGKTLCGRNKLVQYIEWFDGEVSADVTENTNYVITNEDKGNEIILKAKELKIPVITESEFKKIFNCQKLEIF